MNGPFPEDWWDNPAVNQQPSTESSESGTGPVFTLPQLGGDWYLVTDMISGYQVTRQGDQVVLKATQTTVEGGWGAPSVPVAIKLTTVRFGEVPAWRGKPFAYPTDPSFLVNYLPPGSPVDPDIPPAGATTTGLDRQPVLTSGPDRRGSLTAAPRINLVERLLADGQVLAKNQEDYLNSLSGKTVPGSLYLTAFLSPSVNGTEWRITRWVYTFEPNLTQILNTVPPPEDPNPPIPPPLTSPGNYSSHGSEALIVPADCQVNPDPINPQPCLNYPNLRAPWYCRANPGDPICKGY